MVSRKIVEDVIEKAGGAKVIQAERGITRQAVSAWKENGIPDDLVPYFLSKGVPLAQLTAVTSRARRSGPKPSKRRCPRRTASAS